MTMEPQSPQPAGIDRRRLLKKAAVGGAVAWTAPVVLSNPAFAQCFSQTGAALSWNVLSFDNTGGFVTYDWDENAGGNQLRDSIRFRLAIDAACACSPSPSNPSFTVQILERNGDTSTPLTIVTSGSGLATSFQLRAENNNTPIPLSTTFTLGYEVRFSCSGVKYCSQRAFRFTTPPTRPSADTTLGVEYPKKYTNPGPTPPVRMWNSQQGYATTCCAGGIISGPTCF